MRIDDKARVIARDTTRTIPSHIRQSCQRIVIGQALPEYRKEVTPADIRVVKSVYNTHYAEHLSV